MNSASPSRPNKRPYHTPPPQQHNWPATVDPATIPALSRLAPLLSPAEVATNDVHNPVQQIPQENVMQSIDGSVVPNDAVGPSIVITRKPLGPPSAPSRSNFASRRRLKVMLIVVELRRELTMFKVPPSYSPGVHRPQNPASMAVSVTPRAPPSSPIDVADLPHNSQTTPHSVSVDMSDVSLPTPTNTTDLTPTPASSEVVIYDPSRTQLPTQMGVVDHALTPQSPTPGVIATYDPSHTQPATQTGIVDHAHSHQHHLPLPQFAPPTSTGDTFQTYLSDIDFNMDYLSIPGQFDIPYDVSTLKQPTILSDTVVSRNLPIFHLLLCGTRYPCPQCLLHFLPSCRTRYHWLPCLLPLPLLLGYLWLLRLLHLPPLYL